MLLTAVSVVFTDSTTEETSSKGRIRNFKDGNILYRKVDFKSKP